MTLSTHRVYEHLGSATETFDCCDTTFEVHCVGRDAARACSRARERTFALESRLNAFDPESAVAELAATGRVRDEHVARVVSRGLEYAHRTEGAFDVRQGALERDLKAYIRGDVDEFEAAFADGGTVTVEGDVVESDVTLDLNGLAKGYVVDRATDALAGLGRRGFVSGGGDMTAPTGPVAIEDPDGGRHLHVLDTDWNVATSAGDRRQRGGVDHVYDPRDGHVGARHDLVTVVAARDCMEADALATTLCSLPLDAARELVDSWPDAEALVVHGGVFYRSEGFDAHLA